MSGIVFNNLLLVATNKSVVIRRMDRRELPHLTVLFKTTSGEIDGHLKDELAAAGTSPYTPLFKIPAESLSEFENTFSPQFSQAFKKLYIKVRKVRPGWLKRKGYVLALTDSEELKACLLEAAPKLRGRRRVNLDTAKAVFEDPSRVVLVDPSALHSDGLKVRNEPVLAIRGFGKNRMLFLIYAPRLHGGRAWLLANKIAKQMPEVFLQTIPPDIKQRVKDVWFKIHDALRLNEIGINK